jgi:hypothetical protein
MAAVLEAERYGRKKPAMKKSGMPSIEPDFGHAF